VNWLGYYFPPVDNAIEVCGASVLGNPKLLPGAHMCPDQLSERVMKA